MTPAAVAARLHPSGVIPIAENGPLSPPDVQSIRSVIRNQLDAFPRGDAERAFSYASPAIRQLFGTADAFMKMVRRSYEIVYLAKKVFFQKLVETDRGILQPVLIIDSRGRSAEAQYFMERQPDGKWRINGVTMVPVPSRGI